MQGYFWGYLNPTCFGYRLHLSAFHKEQKNDVLMHFKSQNHRILGLGGHHFTEKETGSRMLCDQPKVPEPRWPMACYSAARSMLLSFHQKAQKGQCPGGLPFVPTSPHGSLVPCPLQHIFYSFLYICRLEPLNDFFFKIPFPLKRKTNLHFIHCFSKFCLPECSSYCKAMSHLDCNIWRKLNL